MTSEPVPVLCVCGHAEQEHEDGYCRLCFQSPSMINDWDHDYEPEPDDGA